MAITDILSRKRHGAVHPPGEIGELIRRFVSGEAADYQMSAWLMAVCINGLDARETSELTETMVASGERMDLSSISSRTVDKHSTGGVGDKTTLVLAPLVASAGLTVAKMSGRGLGITGGTIDKLESIPGFSTSLTKEQFLRQANEVGCVIAGQTANLVPADKKMYALRDVTATVDSIPLIASSVMSKKIAGGAKTVLLDVKVGSGAFMKDLESARQLAEPMIDIGTRAGLRVVAVLTAMDQPLGFAVGNAVEVAEAIDTLSGCGPSDLTTLCVDLAATLHSASTGSDMATSRQEMARLLECGAALETFAAMVAAQGGDPDVVKHTTLLPQPAERGVVTATTSGWVRAASAEKIGRACGLLGAGRKKKEDAIDPTAGVVLRKKVGDAVEAGETLAELVWSIQIDPADAENLVRSAFEVVQEPVDAPPLVLETIGF